MKYRVMSKFSGSEATVKFEGTLEQLARQYPRQRNCRQDKLFPNFSGDGFSSETWIEVETERGWRRLSCKEDPRPFRF